MVPHTCSLTEPSSAPNRTSTSARVMLCSTLDASCAFLPLGASMLMLTDRFPPPSLVTETTMSEESKSAPSSFARATVRLLAMEA